MPTDDGNMSDDSFAKLDLDTSMVDLFENCDFSSESEPESTSSSSLFNSMSDELESPSASNVPDDDTVDYKKSFMKLKSNFDKLKSAYENARKDLHLTKFIERDLNLLKKPISKVSYQKLSRNARHKANERLKDRLLTAFPNYSTEDFIASFKVLYPEITKLRHFTAMETLEIQAETMTNFKTMDLWRSALKKRNVQIFSSKREVTKIRNAKKQGNASVPVNKDGKPVSMTFELGSVSCDVPNVHVSNLQDVLQQVLNRANASFTRKKLLLICLMLTQSGGTVKLCIVFPNAHQSALLAGVYVGESDLVKINKCFTPIIDQINSVNLVNPDGSRFPVSFWLSGDAICIPAVSPEHCIYCGTAPNIFNFNKERIIPPARSLITSGVTRILAFIFERLCNADKNSNLQELIADMQTMVTYEGIEREHMKKLNDVNQWNILEDRLKLIESRDVDAVIDDVTVVDRKRGSFEVHVDKPDMNAIVRSEKAGESCSSPCCVVKATGVSIPKRALPTPSWIFCSTRDDYDNKWYHTLCLGLNKELSESGQPVDDYVAPVVIPRNVILLVGQEKQYALRELMVMSKNLSDADANVCRAKANLDKNKYVKTYLTAFAYFGIYPEVLFNKLSDANCNHILQNLENVGNYIRLDTTMSDLLYINVPSVRIAIQLLKDLRTIQAYFDYESFTDIEIRHLKIEFASLPKCRNRKIRKMLEENRFHVLCNHVVTFASQWRTLNLYNDRYFSRLLEKADQKFATTVAKNMDDRLQILIQWAFDTEWGGLWLKNYT